MAKVEARPALFHTVGGKHIVHHAVEAYGVVQHGFKKDLHLLWVGLSQADCFQVQLQGGYGRFQFVADLRDELLLGSV